MIGSTHLSDLLPDHLKEFCLEFSTLQLESVVLCCAVCCVVSCCGMVPEAVVNERRTLSISRFKCADCYSQIRALQPLLSSITTPTTASTGISSETGTQPHPSLPLLRDIITEFRDDELEHLDTAVEEGAQRAPGHALLGAVIGWGCKAAIKICERV